MNADEVSEDPAYLSDDDLVDRLRAAFSSARHPQYDLIVANAQDAYWIAPLEEELARLVYDSYLTEQAAGPVRGPDGPDSIRTLAFECDAMSVEIEVHGSQLIGQVAPPGPAVVSLHTADARVITVETDELGCFVLPKPAAGPLRFRVLRRGDQAVTEWTQLQFPHE
jgi:hypothetical protein